MQGNCQLLGEATTLASNYLKTNATFWKRRAEESAEQLKSQTDYTHMPKRQKKDKTRSWVSVVGGYRMATKRNIGNVSCEALSATIETDFHRATVARWEKVLATAAIQAHADGPQAVEKLIAEL